MMDPLSVAASAIAFAQAVGAIGAGINTLKSLQNMSAEFCDMLNELSSLQALLHQLRGTMEAAAEPGFLLPQRAVEPVTKIQQELSQIVNEIDAISRDIARTSNGLNKKGQQKISVLRWQPRRQRLVDLREKARRCRDNLSACIDLLGFSHQIHQGRLMVEVHGILAKSTGAVEGGFNRMQQTLEQLTNLVDHRLNSVHSRFDALEMQTTLTRPTGALTHVASQPSSVVHIQTSVGQKCSPYCKCQCHTSSAVRTPRWARSLVGSFFVQYNSIPLFDRRTCNISSCRSTSRKSMTMTYSFPKWLVSRAICATAVWGSLTDAGASLHLRVPRVKDMGNIWAAIVLNRVDLLRDWIARKEVLLTDIDDTGDSIINRLVCTEDYDLAAAVLGEFPDTSFPDPHGWTPFSVTRVALRMHTVYGSGHALSVDSLQTFQRIAEIEENEAELSTIIHEAVLGNTNIKLEAALTLDPSRINDFDSAGYSPLHWAARLGNPPAAETLIRHGANVNQKRKIDGNTPLHMAARSSLKSTAMITLLLQHGADVNATNRCGEQPLHFANSAQKVGALVQGGADLDVRNQWGFTPIGSNIRYNFSNADENIRQLFDAGADINLADNYGLTPLMLASSWNNMIALGQLVELGAKLDAVNNMGSSILGCIARFGSFAQIQYFRSIKMDGLDPDLHDKFCYRPLGDYRRRLVYDLFLYQTRPTQAEAFAFCSLILEIRRRNWGSGQFLETKSRLEANGKHEQLRLWVGYQWQRLHDNPELANDEWDDDYDYWFDEIDLWGEPVDYDTGILFDGSDGTNSSERDDVHEQEDDGEFVDAPEY